jgi:hypothetical protein
MRLLLSPMYSRCNMASNLDDSSLPDTVQQEYLRFIKMKAFTILTLLFAIAGTVSASAKFEEPNQHALVSTTAL